MELDPQRQESTLDRKQRHSGTASDRGGTEESRTQALSTPTRKGTETGKHGAIQTQRIQRKEISKI